MMIRDVKSELRERLLAEQSTDPALRSEYERKLKNMLELELPVWKRIWFSVLIGFCVLMGAGAVLLAVTETLPPSARATLLMGAVFAAVWLVFLLKLVRRGTLRRRVDPPIAAGLAFGFALLMCILMAVGGVPTDKVILIAVLFLFPAGLMVLRTVVEQSEMRMQEQLVELQYRLARLAERFEDEGDAGAGVRR